MGVGATEASVEQCSGRVTQLLSQGGTLPAPGPRSSRCPRSAAQPRNRPVRRPPVPPAPAPLAQPAVFRMPSHFHNGSGCGPGCGSGCGPGCGSVKMSAAARPVLGTGRRAQRRHRGNKGWHCPPVPDGRPMLRLPGRPGRAGQGSAGSMSVTYDFGNSRQAAAEARAAGMRRGVVGGRGAAGGNGAVGALGGGWPGCGQVAGCQRSRGANARLRGLHPRYQIAERALLALEPACRRAAQAQPENRPSGGELISSLIPGATQAVASDTLSARPRPKAQHPAARPYSPRSRPHAQYTCGHAGPDACISAIAPTAGASHSLTQSIGPDLH